MLGINYAELSVKNCIKSTEFIFLVKNCQQFNAIGCVINCN
jgi:hypothetical protein